METLYLTSCDKSKAYCRKRKHTKNTALNLWVMSNKGFKTHKQTLCLN